MKIILIIGVAVILASSAPVFAEWPERGLTLVTSNPETVSWSPKVADGRAELLKSLAPRLSRELGVPVSLLFKSGGSGVLAGNMVAGAKPDGYVFGALGGDTSMARVIQGYTPYTWEEFVPVATAWRTIYAVVARQDEKAANLREMSEKAATPRLAHTGLDPIEAPTFLAIRVAQKLDFAWELKQVDSLNPDYLLNGTADVMVLPLGSLNKYPGRGQLKVLTVFSADDSAPCTRGLPNLGDQDLDIELNPPFVFYLPSKVNWRIRSRLSLAINQVLGQPKVGQDMAAACLEPLWEDMDDVLAALNQEYKQQESILREIEALVKP